MGRQHRRSSPRTRPPALNGIQSVERGPDGDWQVRTIPAGRATKMYRCPGCDQNINAGTCHLVTWQEDNCDGRRHWHTPCWKNRARRRPNRQR